MKYNHYKFLGIFELSYDGEFSYDDGEVDFVEWFSIDEIKTMIKLGESFHPEMIFILENYY